MLAMFRSKEFWADKAYDLFVGVPTGAAFMALLSTIPEIGWARLVFIGVCIAFVAGAIFDCVRYESRRRNPPPRDAIRPLLHMVADIFNTSKPEQVDAHLEVARCVVAACLGNSAAKEFSEQVAGPLAKTKAPSYLRALAARPDLEKSRESGGT